MLDVRVARAAQEAGVAGLEFLRGIPGGDRRRAAHERRRLRRRDQGRAGRGARRRPRRATSACFSNADMDYTYRHCGAPDDFIFTEALFAGPRRRSGGDRRRDGQDRREARGEPAAEQDRAVRPSRIRPASKAWQLIDAAGCRGLIVGGAQVSELHCNFLINLGGATAADIETLGETVRRRVQARPPASISNGRSSGLESPERATGSELWICLTKRCVVSFESHAPSLRCVDTGSRGIHL